MDNKKIRQSIRKILSESDWWDNDPNNPVNEKEDNCEYEISYYDFKDGNIITHLSWDRSCEDSPKKTPDYVVVEQDPDLIDYIIKGFGSDTEITEIFEDKEGNITLKSGLASMIIPNNVIESIVEDKVEKVG